MKKRKLHIRKMINGVRVDDSETNLRYACCGYIGRNWSGPKDKDYVWNFFSMDDLLMNGTRMGIPCKNCLRSVKKGTLK